MWATSDNARPLSTFAKDLRFRPRGPFKQCYLPMSGRVLVMRLENGFNSL